MASNPKVSKYFLSFLLLISLLLNSSFVFSANILFLFGGGNVSHKISIWPFVTALADKGHNVTFISSNEKKPTNHAGVTDVTPQLFKDFTAQTYESDRLQDRFDGNGWDIIDVGYDEISLAFCEATLKAYDDDPSFSNSMRTGNFDLIIVNFAFNECGYLLAHHLGTKYILFSSTIVLPWFHGVYGIPMEVSWIPDILAAYTHPMGLLDRMKNFYRYVKGYSRRDSFYYKMEDLYKKNFTSESVPPLVDLERNASLVFLNTHHSIDFARSLPPMFVSIGGMQCWSPVGKLPVVMLVFKIILIFIFCKYI